MGKNPFFFPTLPRLNCAFTEAARAGTQAWLALSAWYDSEHVALPRKVVHVPPDDEEEEGAEEEEEGKAGSASGARGGGPAEGAGQRGHHPTLGKGAGPEGAVAPRPSKARSRRARRTSASGPAQYELELYPLALIVCPASPEGRPLQKRGYTQLFSKVLSTADAHDECCRLLGVSDPARARVHVSMGPGTDAGFAVRLPPHPTRPPPHPPPPPPAVPPAR